MKNKRAEQIRNKERHKKSLKKRPEPSLERKPPTRLERPLILIVCEGKNTEKSYFDQFRLSSARLVTLGAGFNTISLVREAIRLSNLQSYEQVWCVFDKDEFSANDFNNAISIAEASGFKVAYSNQAFEYWFILHFEDHQGGGMPRTDYDGKINSYLKDFGVRYEGEANKVVTAAFFDVLEGRDEQATRSRRELAIIRARRNYEKFDHTSPATEESSTKVFALVEEILKYL